MTNHAFFFVGRIAALSLLLCSVTGIAAESPISFNMQIRGILADNCLNCHGPDSASRKANLRLDREEAAKAPYDGDGHVAIVPGKVDASMIMQRMTTTDPDEIMPPPESKLTLKPEEIALIGEWIKQGAVWEKHWAFIAPKKQDEAVTPGAGNVIDRYVGERLREAGLGAAESADPATLLRRLSFDLTGLPPTLAELDAFLADPTDAAYGTAVDRLLASPAFGERFAVDWLDAARYGDTDGLFEDHPRSVFPWRDWVVKAYNDNLPYDQFIRWQLAGDLIPDATVEQRVATGFLRHNATSNEGGIIDEDYRVKYLIDRVNTTATAFLGVTLECAQCHDHKYDPFSQREYYQFAGFFNSMVGRGNVKGAAGPILKVLTPEDQKEADRLDAEIADLDKRTSLEGDEFLAACDAWRKAVAAADWDWRPAPIVKGVDGDAPLRVGADGLVSRDPTPTEVEEAEPEPANAVPVGRYVRVSLPDDAEQFLTISEVQIMSGGVDVARKGTARQSSDFRGPSAALALDGNRDGRFGSCACTAKEAGAWWEVELAESVPIDEVIVWNRDDCCPERLDRAMITIFDANHTPLRAVQFEQAKQRNQWQTASGDQIAVQENGKARDLLTISVQSPVTVTAVRLTPTVVGEAGADSFVLSKISAVLHPSADADGKKASAKIVDFAQAFAPRSLPKFPAKDAIAGAKSTLNGWSVPKELAADDHLLLVPKAPVTVSPGEELVLIVDQSHEDERALLMGYRIEFSYSETAAQLRDASQIVYGQLRESTRPVAELKELRQHYASLYPPYLEMAAKKKDLETARQALDKKGAVTMIAADGKMRKTFILDRGEYDKPKDEVEVAAPASIMAFSQELPKNRLGLADWLTDPQHPLTARVAVNRHWQSIFGVGIVKTSEDFGTQGDLPSHPELLDYLARDFVESGWDVKRLIRMIVTSDTYRQASVRNPTAAAADSDNRLLAYHPRGRLQAEFLRDHVLAASGRLVQKLGGRGVNPYQPAALFGRANASKALSYKQSKGDDLYRRSLYSYLKRQLPLANMRILGADGRIFCRVRRERTNTPLQALVTLNDPQFTEAARLAADRAMRAADNDRDRVQLLFRLATSRTPQSPEVDILLAELNDRRSEFTSSPERAASYLTAGDTPPPKDLPAPELAALSAVASLVFNLDEALSKN